jgi:hypothetical protein
MVISPSEPGSERPARGKQVNTRGHFRDVQCFGDLAMPISFQVVQHQHLPLQFRQTLHFLQQLLAQDRTIRIARGVMRGSDGNLM